jgi:hypothetical protein
MSKNDGKMDIGQKVEVILEHVRSLVWRQRQLELQLHYQQQHDAQRRKSDKLNERYEQFAQGPITGKQQSVTDKQQAQPTRTTGKQLVQNTDPLNRVSHAITHVDATQKRQIIRAPRLQTIDRQLNLDKPALKLPVDDISLQETRYVPVVRIAPPTQQTAPMTPLPPVAPSYPEQSVQTPDAMWATPFAKDWAMRTTHAPHITQSKPPLQRLEYRLPTDATGKRIRVPLKRRIDELMYHAAEIYHSGAGVICVNRDVYNFELAMIRDAVWYDPDTDRSIPHFYEQGYPIYDPRNEDLLSGQIQQEYAQYRIDNTLDNYTIAWESKVTDEISEK